MELDPNPLAAYSFCYERIFWAFLSPLSPMPILRNQPKKLSPLLAYILRDHPERMSEVRGRGGQPKVDEVKALMLYQ